MTMLEKADKIYKDIMDCIKRVDMIKIRDDANKFFEEYMDSEDCDMAWGLYSRLIHEIDRRLDFLHSSH